jgi:hypothetical protein
LIRFESVAIKQRSDIFFELKEYQELAEFGIQGWDRGGGFQFNLYVPETRTQRQEIASSSGGFN